MRNLATADYFNLSGGRDDKSDSIEMPPTKFAEIINAFVERDSLVKRGGYAKQFTTALNGGDAFQGIHMFENNLQQRALVYAVGGKLFRDDLDGSAPTDITGGLTLQSGADYPYQFINYDGEVVGTDKTNPLFMIESLSSNAVSVPSGSASLPLAAGALSFYYHFIIAADITERYDGRRYPYRLRWNNPPFIPDWPDDQFVDLNRNQRIVAMRQHGEYMVIFQERSMWFMSLSSASTGTIMQTEFDFKPLSSQVGAVSDKAIVETEKGLYWLDRKGVHHMPFGQLTQPIYVGKPNEDFWSGLNPERLQHAAGVDMREQNGVLFTMPFSQGQTTNNYGLFLNYEEGSNYGRYRHPAYSLFTGTDSQPFAFNCLQKVLIDGRDRTIAGGYDGFAYLLQEGVLDDEEGVNATIVSPFYAPQGRTRESVWYQLALDIDLESTKTLTLTYTLYNDPTPSTKSISTTNQTAVLGSFVLGQSQIGRDDLGRIIADLDGRSRYLEIRIDIDASQEVFALHGILLYFKPVNLHP